MAREGKRESEPDDGTQLRGAAETALQTLPHGLSALTMLQKLVASVKKSDGSSS
jgi:hypothetical protein